MSPRDEDLRHNLKFVRDRLQDRDPRRSSLITRMGGLVSTSELLYLEIALLYLFTALLWISRKYPRPLYRWLCLGVGLLLLICVGWLGGRMITSAAAPAAVVTADRVEVRNGPGADFAVGFVLHSGTDVTILGSDSGWYQVGVFDQFKGWLPAASIAPIRSSWEHKPTAQ